MTLARAKLWGAAAGLLLCLAGPSLADIQRDTDQVERKRVQPGETVTAELDCAKGDLTGGGYWLSGVEDDAAFRVLANFPLGDGRWRVSVKNVSDARHPLTIRIYVLCLAP